jgi:NADH:ubiquinone reductase (H+-translocating)
MGDLHRVVVVGCGFGGLQAARALRDAPVRVTVIDKRNFHLFQPLLYQVATGSLSPGDIASPIRAILRHQQNAEVLMGEVVDVDPVARKVILSEGELGYDSLIVGTGSRHYYFGHDEWERLAPGLKTVEDATEIRRRILFAFEAAEREPDAQVRSAWLTFVIVGAGPTGVELAGALGEIANDTLKGHFRVIDPQSARILLVENAPRVLPPYPPDLSARAEESLIGLNVRTLAGYMVTGIDEHGVTLQKGEVTQRISARTVIWAAGVKASPLGSAVARRTGAGLDRGGRILVQPDLTLPEHPEIFVVGDLAHIEQDGKTVPGVAPVAMQQGRYVARVINARLTRKKPPEPFRYFDKGSLAVIGRGAGVAQFGRFHFHGYLAWLLWLFVHLMYLVGFENRVVVFIQWGFQYLTFNRKARLITGPDPRPCPAEASGSDTIATSR